MPTNVYGPHDNFHLEKVREMLAGCDLFQVRGSIAKADSAAPSAETLSIFLSIVF